MEDACLIQFQLPAMFNVIASSLFQKKSCRLPGIGTLEVVTRSAEYDFSNQQISAPQHRIVFINASSSDNTFNEFSAISQLMKQKLKDEGMVEIDGLGSFVKDGNGSLQFVPVEIDSNLLQPVVAERVIHKDAEHAILVGDKETTNVEMTEYYTDETAVAKDKWWIWAIVLGVVAISVIAYYLSQNGIADLGSKNAF
jgi:nucleoid DNA-binding protein